MKLPTRICHEDMTIEDVELREVSGSDIAEVKRIGQGGDIYSAFLSFAVACTKSLGDIEDKGKIRELYKKATFDSVYAVAVFGMAYTRNIDKIEGRYACKCGAVVDHTGDFADPLPVYDSVDPVDVSVTIDPIQITNSKTGEVIMSAETLVLRIPTVEDCIKAFRRYPDDETLMQFEVYKNCLKSIDGREISEKDRASFGDLLFKKMRLSDLNKLSEIVIKDFGTTECVCMKCKRRWSAPLDLTNFFD